jgi:hypothetical protein
MQHPCKQTCHHAERLVVIALLGRPGGRTRERMHHALRSVRREAIDDAITSLEQAGVVVTAGRTVRPSNALIRLERLHVIGV